MGVVFLIDTIVEDVVGFVDVITLEDPVVDVVIDTEIIVVLIVLEVVDRFIVVISVRAKGVVVEALFVYFTEVGVVVDVKVEVVLMLELIVAIDASDMFVEVVFLKLLP